jgi:hypothetical protein
VGVEQRVLPVHSHLDGHSDRPPNTIST